MTTQRKRAQQEARTSRGGVTLVLRPGETLPFEQLPPRSVALDGYVQGPHVDTRTERYSFDHHANCVRHATLSACEMTLDALRVGLDPAGMTVWLNDLDADSVLAAWLFTRPASALDEPVAATVRAVGRVDALGPADPGPGLCPALRWALGPLEEAQRVAPLRTRPASEQVLALEACFTRLDRWLDGGAPSVMPRTGKVPERPPARWEIAHHGVGWVLAKSDSGLGAYRALYATGARAAIVARSLPDGTTEYTVGKASEFVPGFDVPRILAALRAAERSVNPAQPDATSWGGGSTIGGSPRNPDGSASRLSPEEVAAVVAETLAQGPTRPAERPPG